MFAIHSLSGLSLRGPLEQISRSGEARRLRGADTDNDPYQVLGPEESTHRYQAAVSAYREMLPKSLERGPLKHAWQVMSRGLISVTPETAVDAAWKILFQHEVRQAVVTDRERGIVGLVSERALLTCLNVESGRPRDVLPKQVADVMISPIVSAEPITDVRRIVQALIEFRLPGVPIVEESGHAVGFVSRGDILRSVITEPPLSLWT